MDRQAEQEEELKRIKEELDDAKRPIFFFDDDPDGVSSFAQFYRAKNTGRGVIIKSSPQLKSVYLRKVYEFGADKVFVLDKPLISQNFIERLEVPLVWVDHHDSQKEWLKNFQKKDILYYNPRDSFGRNLPVSDISFRIFKRDLWLAMMGAVGDWTIPDFASDFSEKYPDLLDSDIKEPSEALFGTELGHLVKIISFMLKGNSKSINAAIKVLLRIESPYEILHQTTSKGKFIHKKFAKIEDTYNKHLEEAKEKAEDKLLFYFYEGNKFSFTKELSNELLYLFPDKLILVGRESRGIYRMSIRASKVILPPILLEAIQGLDGHGGGHEHACGAHVKKEELELFLDRLRHLYLEEVKKEPQ
jgi:hypothetical protein